MKGLIQEFGLGSGGGGGGGGGGRQAVIEGGA